MSKDVGKHELSVDLVDPTKLDPRDYPNYGEYWVAVHAAEEALASPDSTGQTEEPCTQLDSEPRSCITEAEGLDP